MSFKIKLCLIMCLFFLACAQEEQPYYKPVSVKVNSCISEMSSQLRGYVLGKTTQTKIKKFWSCQTNIVDLFRQVVYVEDDHYTAPVIKGFLSSYFSKQSKDVTLDLISQLLEFKVLLIGGAPEYLTDDEISHLINIISKLSDFSVKLYPHVASWKGLEESNSQQIAALFSDIHLFFDWIEEVISTQNRSYDLQKMQLLLHDVDLLFSGEGTIESFVPLLMNFKKMFVSTGTVIRSNDWHLLFGNLKSFLKLSHKAIEVKKNFVWNNVDSYQKVIDFTNHSLELIESGLSLQKDKQYDWSQIKDLLSSINNVSILKLNLNLEKAKALWDFSVVKLLSPYQIQWSFRADNSLTIDKVSYLKTEINDWIKIQNKITNSQLLNEDYDDFPDMKRILKGAPWPISIDEKGKLLLIKQSVLNDRRSLSVVNALRFVLRPLYRIYLTNEKDTLSGLSIDELKNLWTDISELAEVLGFDFDNESTDYPTKIFREASLFMPRSNGDSFLDFAETAENVSYLLSALAMLDDLNRFKPVYCEAGNEETLRCALLIIKNESKIIFSNIPGIERWVSKTLISAKPKEDIVFMMMTTVGVDWNLDEQIHTSDLWEFFVLSHYIETFLLRFDTDQSETLEIDESNNSYVVFESIFRTLLGYDDPLLEEVSEATFLYLIKKGQLPNDVDPADMIYFSHWLRFPQERVVHADRFILARILYQLSLF